MATTKRGGRFKQIIDQRSREIIADYDTPEAGASLEWTFIEDRGTLNGASMYQLRSRFKAWAAGAIRTEQPRAENGRTFGVPRYNFSIRVDEGALRSVVHEASHPRKTDVHSKGYVNFVDANWKSLSERLPAEGREVDESCQPPDGCREEDVRWMKIGFPDVWYSFYKRPPETVIY